MAQKLKWGILAAGGIARRFVEGVRGSDRNELVAIGSRQQSKADAFGAEHGIARRHGSYEALLADEQVQAVYICTPHPMHAEWTIKAAEAGKHILVEKPMAVNQFEAMAMIDAARMHDVFLMEAFMYRCHPQMAKIAQLIRDKTIGDVQLISVSFAYRAGFDPRSRVFAQDLGGGGILDVGCYPISFARFVAGAQVGKPFADPIQVKGVGVLGETGTDDWAIAAIKFSSGIVAQCSTGVRLNMHDDQTGKIHGSEGTISVPHPWVPGYFGPHSPKLIVKRHDEKEAREITVEADRNVYTYQIEMVSDHIAGRQSPAMSWDDSLGNMRALDAWRAEVGLVYDLEKPKNVTRTITGRPLKKRPDAPMKYGRLAGIDKPISRLVLGCDSNNTMADTAILLDDFFERGGNTFDNSHGYGVPNGATERNLGQWIRNRGIREQVLVIEKGANEPNDHPAGLTRELLSGLDRLQMDRVDIYMIHRDNPKVPIGEWVDVLNEHLSAGRMSVFGLSNFTVARLDAFREYAAKKGLKSFSLVSNQFSLAQVLAPIWNAYLVSSSDKASRDWFIRTQTPLFPWSSQARGFFTERASRDFHGSEEFNKCWYSEENFQRKERANELARKKGVLPINIALAYVLNQPFPTFPLVGPKRNVETASTIEALEIDLSPAELRWLNLEE